MRIFASLGIVLALGLPRAVSAQLAFSVPDTTLRAAVFVICGGRTQGSGVLTERDKGYVITAGHVALDSVTGVPFERCTVSFIDDMGGATNTFVATVVRAVFDARTDRDFAVLKLGNAVAGKMSLPPAMRVNDNIWPGDAVAALGYPNGNLLLRIATGKIESFSRGSIRTNAIIEEGFSGGPAVDTSGNLIGISERINYRIDETGAKIPVRYEMGDILNLMRWLDGENDNGHDEFLLHVDASRYHAEPYHIREEGLGCAYVVHTANIPSVYCLMDGAERLVFPNVATFNSWTAADTQVLQISLEDLAGYRLIGNATMRAGSLVKIQTDPKVYLVTDAFGTLRWIPSETRARVLFGTDWATRVVDVPETFFADYFVGAPLAP